MPFLLKKLLGALAMPLVALPLLALLFLVLLARHSRQPLRAALVALPLLALWALATPIVGNQLLREWEGRWTVLDPAASPAPEVIVVLSGGANAAPGRTAFDPLSGATLQRTLEGIRLARAWPSATLLLSGGDDTGRGAAADAMAGTALALGVPPERVEVEGDSRDTAQQAALLANRLAGRQVVLVTSAVHMERALGLFRGRGLDPVPAPADFADLEPSPHDMRAWLPSARVLALTSAYLHERLGLAWARLGDRFGETPADP